VTDPIPPARPRMGPLDVLLLAFGIGLVAAAFWWLGWVVWILPATAILLVATVVLARRGPPPE
jgi:4-hydroxybenzoate polyprenyltransferase